MLPERCTGCMRRQLAFSCTLAVVLLALLAAPALAGGWAVTTVDPLPSSIQAGQTYQVGFTIRQHGVSPFNQASPRVRAHLGDSYLSFGATRDGDGHYIARVEFPRDGAWTWVIDQTPFATQELGTLSLQPIVVLEPPVEVEPGPAVPGMRSAVARLARELVGLGIDDVDTGRTQPGHDKIASFDMRMRSVRTQRGAASIPSEVVQLIAH